MRDGKSGGVADCSVGLLAAPGGGVLARGGLRGRVPLWVPLVAVLVLFAVGVRAMERRARAEGYGWVDPAGLDFASLPDWADERWSESLDELLLGSPIFRTDDLESLAALEVELASLAFVRDARVREVLWPGGLEVELELREPVGCIPVGRHFLPVSDEGVVLPGLWTRPPQVSGRFLPVIAPLEDAHGIFAKAGAGDWLAEQRHLDALAIVRSAREYLGPADALRLGRFSVQAVDARQTSPDVPGSMLLLEGERRVWFGRPPVDELLGVPAAPGELPAWAKWEAVARALALLEPSSVPGGPFGSWRLVDVRWDRPEITLEPAELIALVAGATLAQLPEEMPRHSYEAPPASAPRAASSSAGRWEEPTRPSLVR
ncbi:MAG: hypothetical protein ACI82F_004659 [Planctomycetota bacterium]|jgi:hypothetical protein